MSDFENEEAYDEAADGFDGEEQEEGLDAAEAADGAEGEDVPEDANASSIDDELYDKANKAARLLRARRAALREEAEERNGKPSLLVRAINLLTLKPKMEQKEMADLLGCRLRELDAVLADAEEKDIVARIEPDEPDMRKVQVMAADDALELAEAEDKKEERLVPELSDEDAAALDALLDKVIDPLVALGLDDDRQGRGGFRGGLGDHRGGDRGDRGGRGGFDGRGRSDQHGGYRGGSDRGGYRGGRDERGGHDDHRGGYRGGSDRGGYRGHDDHRSPNGYRGHDDHRGGFRGNSGRGGYRGGNDRGGRGGFGGFGGRGGNGRGGYHDNYSARY